MSSLLERRVPVVGGWWWVGGKPNLVISDELIKKNMYGLLDGSGSKPIIQPTSLALDLAGVCQLF